MSNIERLTFEKLSKTFEEFQKKTKEAYTFTLVNSKGKEFSFDIREYELKIIGEIYCLHCKCDPLKDTIIGSKLPILHDGHFIILEGMTKEIARELCIIFPFLLKGLSSEGMRILNI